MSEMGTVVAALAALSVVVEQISLTNYYGGHGRVAMALLQRAVGSNDTGMQMGGGGRSLSHGRKTLSERESSRNPRAGQSSPLMTHHPHGCCVCRARRYTP